MQFWIEGRLDSIEGRVGTPEDRLDDFDRGIIWDAIVINNTLSLNLRTIARNRENLPYCESLRKTVSSLPFSITYTASRSQAMTSTMFLLSHEHLTDKAWLHSLSRHLFGLCHRISMRASVATQQRIFPNSWSSITIPLGLMRMIIERLENFLKILSHY